MSRRKGLKRWDEITTEGWLALMADKTVMSSLVMQIFWRLYHSEDYMDNGKSIAAALHMEYRALNAGVGWAGSKIRDMYEKGLLLTYRSPAEKEAAAEEEEPEEFTLKESTEGGRKRSPWEYVFDGTEGEDGIYFWVLKPEAAAAFREIMEADIWHTDDIRRALASDVSVSGAEGNLFAESSESTVAKIARVMEESFDFKRKSMTESPCCAVCGVRRISLLHAVPYGQAGAEQKGLLFCPTHGALFAAHLISFSEEGKILVSKRLSEEERALFGLVGDLEAKSSFSRRRMADHRKIFRKEVRKQK